MHRQWMEGHAAPVEVPVPPQQSLALGASEATLDQREERENTATSTPVEVAPAEGTRGETTLEEVAPPASAVVQHLGSWLLLGGLRELGFYDLADQHRGDALAMPSLRTAIDAAAIALALGEFCVEGVRRLATPSMETLLRHLGGVSASWVRRVLHDFADVGSKTFPGAVASRLLQRTGEGEERVWLYVDGHMRPYTGREVIRKGWRMQDKRAVPGTTDYYCHDEEGRPLWQVSTTSHDSLCAWLMPVVDFAHLSLGDEVKPVLVFDRGGAFPATMAELRDADAEFVTYERKPHPELGATEFKNSLTITLASRPRRPPPRARGGASSFASMRATRRASGLSGRSRWPWTGSVTSWPCARRSPSRRR